MAMINNKAVHSWINRIKCRRDIKKPPSPLNPPGINSQLTKPVTESIEKRINDKTLINQRGSALPFDIEVSFPNHKMKNISFFVL